MRKPRILQEQPRPEQPRPEPRREQPRFNFETMEARLARKVDGILKLQDVNFGGIKTVRTSRWTGNQYDASGRLIEKGGRNDGILRNLASPVKGLIEGDWLLSHPFKLIGMMFSRNAGRPAFKKDVRNAATARALRAEQGLEANFRQAQADLKQEAQAALNELRAKFESGQVNSGNRNMHVDNFNKAVKLAEAKFLKTRGKMLNGYGKELRARAA